MVEVTDNSTYDLKAGFYLDTGPLADPYGTYVCTSTPDAEDETDTVKFKVSPPEGCSKAILFTHYIFIGSRRF